MGSRKAASSAYLFPPSPANGGDASRKAASGEYVMPITPTNGPLALQENAYVLPTSHFSFANAVLPYGTSGAYASQGAMSSAYVLPDTSLVQPALSESKSKAAGQDPTPSAYVVPKLSFVDSDATSEGEQPLTSRL